MKGREARLTERNCLFTDFLVISRIMFVFNIPVLRPSVIKGMEQARSPLTEHCVS